MDRQALHFGNIARSKDESARSDLWSDYLVAPALGYDSTPRDMVSLQNMTLIAGQSWGIDKYIYVSTNAASPSGLYGAFTFSAWPITIVLLGKVTNVGAAQYSCYCSIADDGASDQIGRASCRERV